jgi:hypothetical protein
MATTIQQGFLKMKQNLEITGLQAATVSTRQKNIRDVMEAGLAHLRIVTWNCGMALARKAPSLLALNPDVAIVQECSKNSVDDLHGHGFTGLWFGANPNKGLAVFCRKGFALQAVGKPFGKWVVPVRVRGAVVDFNVSTCWRSGPARSERSVPTTTSGRFTDAS